MEQFPDTHSTSILLRVQAPPHLFVAGKRSRQNRRHTSALLPGSLVYTGPHNPGAKSTVFYRGQPVPVAYSEWAPGRVFSGVVSMTQWSQPQSLSGYGISTLRVIVCGQARVVQSHAFEAMQTGMPVWISEGGNASDGPAYRRCVGIDLGEKQCGVAKSQWLRDVWLVAEPEQVVRRADSLEVSG